MIPEVSRCTLDMLSQFDRAKTQDVGKKYGLWKKIKIMG
jgi:hypothetical protein